MYMRVVCSPEDTYSELLENIYVISKTLWQPSSLSIYKERNGVLLNLVSKKNLNRVNQAFYQTTLKLFREKANKLQFQVFKTFAADIVEFCEIADQMTLIAKRLCEGLENLTQNMVNILNTNFELILS